MSQTEQFTIEQLCKFMSQGKLMGGRCKKCGKIHFPPRPVCDVCYSKEFEWVELPTRGKLLTYTVIHIAPAQFQALAPYAMGIVELENGLRVPGMIKEVAVDQLKIGMSLTIVFEACTQTQQWPQWPRYHFKPV
jgi:uncharacterized OB-fold protein